MVKINEIYDPEYEHDTDDHVVKHKDDNDQDFWAVYNSDGDIVKVFYTKSKAIDYAEKNHDALMKNEIVAEKWSEKYKRSINCNNPKGFSQKAHCQGRKKNESVNQVRGSEKTPAKQKPSRGPNSPHPYRGRLVGEAEVQQELPVDLKKIRKAIQTLESRNYFTSEEADEMRRAVQAIATGRDTIYPKRLLQLLTTVA